MEETVEGMKKKEERVRKLNLEGILSKKLEEKRYRYGGRNPRVY